MSEVNEAIGQRIKELRKEHGLTLEQLGSEIGVTRAYISFLERGVRMPGRETLSALCDFFGVDMDYLTGRSDERERDSADAVPSLRSIPVYSCISCGTGLWVDERPEGYTGAPDWMLKSGVDYFANPAQGDSMIPVIDDGDCLIFAQSNVVGSGQIGAFSLNGEYYCKKFYKDSQGRYWLISENREYKPILIKPEDDFRVLGIFKLRITTSGQ